MYLDPINLLLLPQAPTMSLFHFFSNLYSLFVVVINNFLSSLSMECGAVQRGMTTFPWPSPKGE